jgi:NitT/TauT family transport system ATP-binding protein
LEVTNLCVGYGGNRVLRNVTLNVHDGEFVSVLGKSGCGKSTLLLALAGFIGYEGQVIGTSDIGMVFQNYAVFPWLTVRGNVAFGLQKLARDERNALIDRHLEFVGLTQHADKYPAQLSGGQTQRVALARALAPRPKVIFMDEPFGALDMFTRARMQEWLTQMMQAETHTVLFVTHNIEEAIFVSDRIVLIGDGTMLDDIPVPFPRPRDSEIKFMPEFVDLNRRILKTMERSTTTFDRSAQ